jgi:hypothetical protein
MTILQKILDFFGVTKKCKIMLLGYSGVGKTLYLGSLHKLGYDTGKNGFALINKEFYKSGKIGEIHDGVIASELGEISTTKGIIKANMVLKKGLEEIIDVEIFDIEGQAIEPGLNIENAKKIISTLKKCDAAVLVVKAPKNQKESRTNLDFGQNNLI